MLVEDLRRNLVAMPQEDALSLILSIRKSRQTSKRAGKKRKEKSSVVMLSELASGMSKEQLANLLNKLEGNN